MSVSQTLIEAAYALGIGLVVGFEREHHGISDGLAPEDVPGEKRPAAVDTPSLLGARTFALLALAGWLVGFLGDHYPLVAPIGLAAIIAMVAIQYVLAARTPGQELGLTTEAAAVVVVLLGLVVHLDRALAVTLGLGAVLLLISKPWTRAAVVRLRRLEVTATVQLLVLVAIVLPLLPTEPVDYWEAIPPRKVGIFVVLIAGVEYVGYVLNRLLGARRGAAIAGLLGGLTSSTAVTAAMARQARRHPGMTAAGQLATFLANAVMGVRVVVVTALLSPAVAWHLAAPMAALVLVLLGGALWRLRRRDDGTFDEQSLELRNPFALIPALTWGSILCVVLLGAHLATVYLGPYGLLLAAAASGLADVDAITLAASRQAAGGGLTAEVAALAILIAVSSNTVVKAGIALVGGGRRFGVGVAAVFAIAALAGGAVAVATLVI